MKYSLLIKLVREKNGITQEDMANQCDLKSYQHISKWETGACKPSLKNAKKLAEIYGGSPNEYRTND